MNEELENQIDYEKDKLNAMNQIQEELNIMNNSLNNCIDIAYSSAINPKSINNYNDLKDRVNESNRNTNNNLDMMINKSKDTIHELEKNKEDK